MKVLPAILILVFSVTQSYGQKGIEALVQAEKNFAAYSVSHSTKEAFLAYTDSNSIMFNDGKAVKAIDFWGKKGKRNSVLNWQPRFAEISASGDFGYTTGPWTFQSSATDTVVARGQYATVWHTDENGNWKFLLDLGVDDTPAEATGPVTIIPTTGEAKPMKIRNFIYRMGLAERRFIRLFSKNKIKAYRKFLSANSILNRNGLAPAVQASDQQRIIDSTQHFESYTLESFHIAPSADIGYAYGTITMNGKTENYFRVWRREKKGWKIALEVLRY